MVSCFHAGDSFVEVRGGLYVVMNVSSFILSSICYIITYL